LGLITLHEANVDILLMALRRIFSVFAAGAIVRINATASFKGFFGEDKTNSHARKTNPKEKKS